MKKDLSRRHFLKTTIAASALFATVGSDVFASAPAAKYTRYNVMSAGGQKALASYAKAIEIMIKLPPDDPNNWFRHALIHLMDCPHGNWWFLAWHRGYIGHFEQAIRRLSGDPSFAIPYWDWTTYPQIPDGLFDGPLNPTGPAYEPFTSDLAKFTSYIQPTMKSYWNTLTKDQILQLNNRLYTDFDKMWNDVTGNGNPENMAFAQTSRARYPTRENPKLDANCIYNSSNYMVLSGLEVTEFYDASPTLSINSAKTTSHNSMPASGSFSIIEGFPHNLIHNYIGGYGYLNAPWGNMTNNLSPVDPLVFLHHSNMDRLWDVWTRKQKARGWAYLPADADLTTFSAEPFLFFADGDGKYITNGKAGDYLDTEAFGYDYEPGFGEEIVHLLGSGTARKPAMTSIKGVIKKNVASLKVQGAAVSAHLSARTGATLFAEVTVSRPGKGSDPREFDVLVGAPAGLTEVSADSPYYAGTISFVGTMPAMKGMDHDATFAVPLPKKAEAFKSLEAAPNAQLNIRIVPTQKNVGKTAPLKSVTLKTR
jgi:tyrosinase